MKVYKVVHKDGRQLLSAIVCGESATTYSTKKYVQAPLWLRKNKHHVTCFKRLNKAKDFLHQLGWYPPAFAIYEATGKGQTKCTTKCELFGLRYGKLTKDMRNPYWPLGTIMVRKLKLRRRIK